MIAGASIPTEPQQSPKLPFLAARPSETFKRRRGCEDDQELAQRDHLRLRSGRYHRGLLGSAAARNSYGAWGGDRHDRPVARVFDGGLDCRPADVPLRPASPRGSRRRALRAARHGCCACCDGRWRHLWLGGGRRGRVRDGRIRARQPRCRDQRRGGGCRTQGGAHALAADALGLVGWCGRRCRDRRTLCCYRREAGTCSSCCSPCWWPEPGW